MNIEKQITKFSLLDKFSDQSSSSTRGNVIITKNKANQEIVGVELEETVVPSAEYQSTLQSKCDENKFYQLEVAELNLFTSMTACYYLNTIGLNDTISFQMDATQKNIVGMQIEYKDIKHLASLEKNPKKKRLMQERQYEVHAGKTILSKMLTGSKPEYMRNMYDSQGGELKAAQQQKQASAAGAVPGQIPMDKAPVEEAEKTFFQKYWWHLMVGMLLLQSVMGKGEEGPAAA